MPEAYLATNGQHSTMTGRYRNLMTRALPQLHERWRVAEKLLTGRRQGCSAFVPNEQRSSELLLEGADPCTNGGLTDVQPLSSPNKTSGRNDLQKGSGEFGVHIGCSIKTALKCQLNSFVSCVR